MHTLLHWLAVHVGADHSAGGSVYYNFWSGFGSDLGEVTLVGAIVAAARHKNCHVKGCWRLGHPHEGVVRCRKHPHGA